MAEKIGKTVLKKDNMSIALQKLESVSNKYIGKGSDSAAKKKRENEILFSFNKLASEIENWGNCPRGSHWDPISMTCKSD
jgi:hypothetical protein